tara:strand:- start:113422 stop:113652 length:231 start_codon:yes stop_codon:yes gene_type:complete
MSARKKKAQKLSYRALLKRATEDVPHNSGHNTFGVGPFAYTKIAMDGSSRVFRFQSHHQAMEAMEAGMYGTLPNCN